MKRRKLAVIISSLFLVSCTSCSLSDSSNNTSNVAKVSGYDIYKGEHEYPQLSNECFVTLSELAENKDKYIENIKNSNYDNILFEIEPDFDIPDEIGKYQIMCINNYHDHAEETIEFMVGSSYDANCLTDYYSMDDPPMYPHALEYSYGTFETGMVASVNNTGTICYYENRMYWKGLMSSYMDDKTIKEYVLKSDYEDDSYTFDNCDVSISQFADNTQNYLEELFRIAHCENQFMQIAVLADYDDRGNIVYHSVVCNAYKSLPIFKLYEKSGAAIEEFNLQRGIDNWSAPMDTTSFASSVDGITIQALALRNQFADYKTVEKYEKIISPDIAARLLSEKLAPDLEDSVIGVGLTYYPYYIGSSQTGPLTENYHSANETQMTHREMAPWAMTVSYDLYELTPFWVFYFDFAPGTAGLVNCVTGEVSYLHNHINDFVYPE